jgi:hypothetical protein
MGTVIPLAYSTELQNCIHFSTQTMANMKQYRVIHPKDTPL